MILPFPNLESFDDESDLSHPLAPPTPSLPLPSYSLRRPPLTTSRPSLPTPLHTPVVPSPSAFSRWPGTLEFQSWAASHPTLLPSLLSCAHLVYPSLSTTTRCTLRCVSSSFRAGPVGYPLPFFRPWQPLRRRRIGFGTPSRHRTLTSDAVPFPLVIHHAWLFLSVSSRCTLYVTSLPLRDYITFRSGHLDLPIASLRARRTVQCTPDILPPQRALQFGAALLRFNFIYGDFVRWLGGEYTNADRDWASTFTNIHARRWFTPPPGLPTPDFNRAYRIFTEGVPLLGHYDSSFSSVLSRNDYDNHPGAQDNIDAIETKFAAEEDKSFHIHLPRFMIHLVYGLFLAPLLWVIQKGKGRICVDCTYAGPDEAASINSSIEKPSVADPDACPPIFYGTAWTRFLTTLWRMRLTRPHEDILCHCDDIDAAFRRILYHPDLAPAFAYVLRQYLIIPVGQVFGSRSAPSFFSLTSDVRAFLASVHDFPPFPTMALLSQTSIVPLPPEWDPATMLTPACPDPLHPPLSPAERRCFLNATYVDDNGIAAYRDRIYEALQRTIYTAYELYGFPEADRRQSCLNSTKWAVTVSTSMRYLGYFIDTRLMLVTWPLDKRLGLCDDIDLLLETSRKARPRLGATVIGKLVSAGHIAPWGPYIVASLRRSLKSAVRSAAHRSRHFWRHGFFRLSQGARTDLSLARSVLALPDDSLWSRPIALLIPRTATHNMYSDASYGGIGGWSPEFNIMWRVMRDDLTHFGFAMVSIDSGSEPVDPSQPDGLHINPLEFLAVIINLWIAITSIRALPRIPSGYILSLFSDNTSALAWLKYAATTDNSTVRRLARLTSSLYARALANNTAIQQGHIPGVDNIEADYLSRLLPSGQPPSWDSVISQCSRLRPCHLCLLPSELLFTLASFTLSRPIVEPFDVTATRLLTLAPVTSFVSSAAMGSMSTLQN